jgi:chitin synthase
MISWFDRKGSALSFYTTNIDSFYSGSFFAGVYALWHWGKIFQTAHSSGRKVALLVENIYLTINLLFSWFAIVSFESSHRVKCKNDWATYCNQLFTWITHPPLPPPLQGQFFLSFFILTQSLVTIQNPPFSPSAANIVHQILTNVYLILIIVLFLIAMGNRPQG